MIETEEQRRWWFATHPEFSRKRSTRTSTLRYRTTTDRLPNY